MWRRYRCTRKRRTALRSVIRKVQVTCGDKGRVYRCVSMCVHHRDFSRFRIIGRRNSSLVRTRSRKLRQWWKSEFVVATNTPFASTVRTVVVRITVIYMRVRVAFVQLFTAGARYINLLDLTLWRKRTWETNFSGTIPLRWDARAKRVLLPKQRIVSQ